MSLEKTIFRNKTLSDLFGEIYDNSAKTRKQLRDLISDLSKLVETPADAQRLVPLIKEYMELGVKNDDQLIKLATIIQRIETANRPGTTDGFDFSDLQGLLEESHALEKRLEQPEVQPDGSK